MFKVDTCRVESVEITVMPGKYFVQNGGGPIKEAIESQAYPEGTVVEITLPKQEDKIILPNGMWWDERNYLWFNGLVVARAKETRGWYHPPFTLATKEAGNCENADQVKRLIELALAYWGHYGVRKECVGEKKHTYTVSTGEFAGKTLTTFQESCWTQLYTQLNASGYPEGTTIKITYPEIKSEPEVVYPGGAVWDDEGNLCCCGEGIMQIGSASRDGGTAMYAEPSGYLHRRTASAGFKSQDEAKAWVVSQLATHGHYGFKFKGEE